MNIPLKTWMKYKDKLAAIDRRAEVEMISFVQSIGGYGDHVNECLDYAFALATKYGEAAGAAACELYEAVAAASGITLEAMPAATATYEEVAKSLNGIHKISNDPAKLSQGVSRLVKRTAADTTLQNAVRDGAYFAWVPSGDTCAFCLMLASNGWRKAGKKTIKGDHAEHIHANCDCQYAVTFDPLSGVEGFNPAEYEAMFDGIDGDWNKKVNAVRRQQYAKNKDRINAQKRTAYANRTMRTRKEGDPLRIPEIPASTVLEKVASGEYSLKLSSQNYNKHSRGHRDYERYAKSRAEKGKTPPSVLTISKDEAQRIIDNKSGTGIIKTRRDGTALDQEMITCDRIIGEYYSHGRWNKTNKAIIHHGRKGSHIVPHRGSTYD